MYNNLLTRKKYYARILSFLILKLKTAIRVILKSPRISIMGSLDSKRLYTSFNLLYSCPEVREGVIKPKINTIPPPIFIFKTYFTYLSFKILLTTHFSS